MEGVPPPCLKGRRWKFKKKLKPWLTLAIRVISISLLYGYKLLLRNTHLCKRPFTLHPKSFTLLPSLLTPTPNFLHDLMPPQLKILHIYRSFRSCFQFNTSAGNNWLLSNEIPSNVFFSVKKYYTDIHTYLVFLYATSFLILVLSNSLHT